MAWYWIVLITLTTHSIIGVIISVIGKDEWLEAWGVGFVWLLLWVILYLVRAWRTYSKKRNISRLQFILGKRAKDDD